MVNAVFNESIFKNVKFGIMPDLLGHKDSVYCLCTSIDGNLLFSGSED